MSDIRVLPLPKVDARYGDIGGKYPERVRIAMSDGTTQWYRIEVEQPRPQVMETLRLIRAMKDNIYGGKGKTGDAATSTGQRTKNTVVSIPQKGKLNNESSL